MGTQLAWLHHQMEIYVGTVCLVRDGDGDKLKGLQKKVSFEEKFKEERREVFVHL